MKTNNNLTKFIFGSVLFCGLIACSADKNFSSTAAPEPWRLQEPELAHEGSNNIRLAMFDTDRMELNSNDGFIFTEKDFDNITLTVTSQCQMNDDRYPEASRKWPLRARYNIYEFLPVNALFDPKNPLNKKLSCTFYFKAENGAGSTHGFSVTFKKITLGRGSLPIAKDGNPISLNASNLYEIHQSSIATYTLPALDADTAYVLRCEQQEGEVYPSNGPIHFDQFVMKPNSQLSESSDLCRVIETNAFGEILAVSDLISWRPDIPEVKVEKVASSVPMIQPKFPGYTPIWFVPVPNDTSRFLRFPDSVFKVTNSSPKTIHLVVPAGSAQTYDAKLYLRHAENTYAHFNLQSHVTVYNPQNAGFGGVARSFPSETLSLDILPGNSQLFEIGPSFDLTNCASNGLFISSFVFTPQNEKGLSAYVVDEPEAGLAANNIVETIALEPKYEHAVQVDYNNGWSEKQVPDEEGSLTTIGCANEVKAAAPANNKSADL